MSNTKKKNSATQKEQKSELQSVIKAMPVDVPEVKEDKKEEIIEKSEICKVTYVDNFIYIDFKGFGLITPNDKKHTEPELEVFYHGDIGDNDFRFRV